MDQTPMQSGTPAQGTATPPLTPPTPAPAQPKAPTGRDYTTMQETVINPNRPDFNKEVQKRYLSSSEYLEGEKVAEAQEGEQQEHIDGEVTNTEGSEHHGEDQDTQTQQQNTQDLQNTGKDTRTKRVAEYLNQLAREKAELRRMKQELEDARKNKPNYTLDELRERAKEDPFAVLEDLGQDYNSLTQRILQGKDSDEKRLLQKAISEVENLKKEIHEKETERQREQINLQLQQAKMTLQNHIQASPEKYEMINASQAYDTVFEVIRQYYDQYQKVLSFDEAADVVENELENSERARLESLMKTKKARTWNLFSQAQDSIQQQVDSSQESPVGVESPSPTFAKKVVSPQSQKTITGQMVSSSVSRPKRRLTRDESIAEAAKLLRFNN